jgi:hypothetical protein
MIDVCDKMFTFDNLNFEFSQSNLNFARYSLDSDLNHGFNFSGYNN